MKIGNLKIIPNILEQSAIAIKEGNKHNIELRNSNDKFDIEIATNTANNITSIAFSPDGKLIAIGDEDGNIELKAISLVSNSIDSQLLATFKK